MGSDYSTLKAKPGSQGKTEWWIEFYLPRTKVSAVKLKDRLDMDKTLRDIRQQPQRRGKR